MPFPYKTVLVTGATSGIGHGLAERLIEHGSFVIAVGRRQDRLDALVTKYGAGKVASEPFDVADLAAIPAWVKQLVSLSSSLLLCSNPKASPAKYCLTDNSLFFFLLT
jgi:NADP-dependent 3-hydroxy acid dehydrogenase YdfG